MFDSKQKLREAWPLVKLKASKSLIRRTEKMLRKRDKNLFARRGDILSCNSCDTELYEFTSDVFKYDYVVAGAMKGIHGRDNPRDFAKYDCPNCGSWLVSSGKVISRVEE